MFLCALFEPNNAHTKHKIINPMMTNKLTLVKKHIKTHTKKETKPKPTGKTAHMSVHRPNCVHNTAEQFS